MKYRTFIVPVCLALLSRPDAVAEDGGDGGFALSAESAVLDITPRTPGRTFLALPSLEYRFRLRADCADGEPASFALNVADSRLTLDRAELAGADTDRELSLEIPSEQLAPVALSSFCVVPPAEQTPGDDAADARTELLVRDVLAAQASLLCATESERRMIYVSRPLDLRLVCDRPGTDPEEAASPD